MPDKDIKNKSISEQDFVPTLEVSDVDKKRKKKEKQKCRRQKKAMKKKQRKTPVPRAERLKIAPKWLEEYDINVHGKNIIRAYRKHFHVEPICALQELQILEYPLTEEQITKFHETERNKIIQAKAKKRKRRERLEEKREQLRLKKLGIKYPEYIFSNSDDNFFFIAGYTSGGAPYGITWEEMNLEPYENPDE